MNPNRSRLGWQKPKKLGQFPFVLFVGDFFRIAPILTRKNRKVADNIGTNLQGVSPNDLIGGTIGLISGLIIALLLDTDLSERRQPEIAVSDDYDYYLRFFCILGLGNRQQKSSKILNPYAKERWGDGLQVRDSTGSTDWTLVFMRTRG